MGYYVGVQFSFSCDSLWRLKEIASNTLAESYKFCGWRGKEEDKPSLEQFNSSYTRRMLEQVANNTEKYIHCGNKGYMFMWGGVWNFYSAENEIYFLKEFLWRCWKYAEDSKNILFDGDRALLIVNREQSEMSQIYEFALPEDRQIPAEAKGIIVRETSLDFCWNQY